MKNGNIDQKRWGPPRPREVKREDQSMPPLYSGLTKREMFAMHAMQGMLSHHGGSMPLLFWIAKNSVSYADALLAELEKQETNQ